MTIKKTKNKIGATPGKLALIAVLAVVLVVVIVVQFPSGPDVVAHSSMARQPVARQPQAVNQKNEASLPSSDQPSDRTWPKISLEQAVAYDPFKTPDWIANQSLASDENQRNDPEALSRLQEQGASIVMISGQGKAATIGSRHVQVGDIIEGYRITDITTSGVIVSETGLSEIQISEIQSQ